MPEITYREAINKALFEEMERDENVIIFGEDIGIYGGSFKVTKGLLEKFGERRVVDTPISEAGIIGAAVGMALGGLRPVPELMTVNFSLVAFDQIINHMAQMRYMFGGQPRMPITVRAPGGGGHQLGSQHSHSLEAFFMRVPGLKVVTPSTPADARLLLASSIRDDNPVMFLEHEGLYNMKGEVPDTIVPEKLGAAKILREGKDVSLVSYGAMTHVCLAAAEKLASEGVSPEVIDLRTLRPWDRATVFNSVKKTKRAVLVEEAWPTCGVTAELAASIYENVFDYIDAPLQRVTGADVPLPYAKNLEQSCIPNPDQVYSKAKAIL